MFGSVAAACLDEQDTRGRILGEPVCQDGIPVSPAPTTM